MKRKVKKFRIITNENTPPTNFIDNPKIWIKDKNHLLESHMAYSMSKKNCVGLASNQVEYNGKRILERFFSVKNFENNTWQSVINPNIKTFSGESFKTQEKCLTWPGKTLLAIRTPTVTVSYWDINGIFVEDRLINGFEAQIWQHELDHLNGNKETVILDSKIKSSKQGRNELCSCGSGKKYKKCCSNSQEI